MRQYSDNEIAAYIKSGDPLDKAGAYAIQNGGFHPVENFNGCFASVMGLPLCHVSRLAAKFNLASSSDMVAGCESINRYICPIHAKVESGADVG
jgi:predicted house-cleaning NTP pyrophosphatase (Maf/HAM1 superfamily)